MKIKGFVKTLTLDSFENARVTIFDTDETYKLKENYNCFKRWLIVSVDVQVIDGIPALSIVVCPPIKE